jgi:hypothetical protein
MKSTPEQMEKRGFIVSGIDMKYIDSTFKQHLGLLKSRLPFERTIGARLLQRTGNKSSVKHLVAALADEKMLYTKIEICNSLVSFGKDSILPLIGLLGKIGNNQYREIPAKTFNKNNYPLPRDIAARTLGRIGQTALTELIKCLNSDDMSTLSEAIDAIGFISFYNDQKIAYYSLRECISRIHINDLIRCKIYRAMSAFPESETFLKEQIFIVSNGSLRMEIERSLSILSTKKSRI